jgi:hypothetical protein
MRKLAAILVALALPASMLAAPFSHVHDPGVADDHVAEHHSGGLELHLHLVGVETGGQTWAPEADASAHSLNLYKFDLTDSFTYAVAIVVERYVADVAVTPYGWARDCDARIHDPPRISSRSPRAPPA